MSKKVKRLYNQFQPENYLLKLTPDPKKLCFEGEVVITGKKTGPPSKRITLHQYDLDILEASIEQDTKDGIKQIEIDRINKHRSFNELRLHSNSTLYPGKYRVRIKFSGKITKQMHGLYPCPFEHMGEQKVILATQFESHHAREVFPCIDEPEAKATFDLTLFTPPKQKVLSNTPLLKQGKDEENKLIENVFETTPIMSTYLLAFVIGEIHSISTNTKSGIEVNSWSSVAHPKSFLEYANNEAADLLDFFADYFKTPFPLPKIDQVALPDFESGAMENWGLITFREALLLADPVNRSISSEQRLSEVISHELSHQWFGNLVTMKWWDDLWLNESFASIMEHLALDKIHPDWQQWESFTSHDIIHCSNRDIYQDVQPVIMNVNHPDEISTLFDTAIVYAKGARLLKMLFSMIGEEACRDALKSYFAKHAYKNTSREDLWNEFSKASGKDISKIMTPWLTKSGMPLLSVNTHGNELKLSQKRLLLDGKDDSSLWPIPLLGSEGLDDELFSSNSTTIKLRSSKPPVFNVDGSGHYVVNYTDKEHRKFVDEQIINRSITSPGRINRLNDLLILTQCGDYSLADILDLVSKCNDEPRDAVWSLMARTLGFASLLTEGDKKAKIQINKFKEDLSGKWYETLGWDDKEHDDLNTKLLRHSILSLRISSENDDAINEALKRFKGAGNVEALPSEQRAMIACVEVRFGETSSIEKLKQEYVTSPNPDVQHSISAALCATRDKAVARDLIKWGLENGGKVRDQDTPRWFAYLMRNEYTRNEAWQWLVRDWGRLYETYSKSMDHFIIYASSPISSKREQNMFRKFFEPKIDDISLNRSIKVALSTIDSKVKWRTREEPQLKQYLLDYK